MNNRLGRLTLLALAAVMFLFAPGHAQQDSAFVQVSQPSAKFHRKGIRAVPNQYIVVLDQDATGVAGDVAKSQRQATAVMQTFARTPSA